MKIGAIIPKQYLEIYSSNVLRSYYYIWYEFNYGNVQNEIVFNDYPTTASTKHLAEIYLKKSFAHCIKNILQHFEITEAVFSDNFINKHDFAIKSYSDIYYKNKYWGFISDFNVPKGEYYFVCHIFPPITNKLAEEGKLPLNKHKSWSECQDYAQELFTLFARTVAKDLLHI